MRFERSKTAAALFAALAVLGCGGSGESAGATSPPVISSFRATPSSISPGGSTRLTWVVTGATSLSINQGIGPVTGSSITVTPPANTQYTLTANNSVGSDALAVDVVVSSSTAPVASVVASLAATSLTTGQTTQATAVLRDASNNVLADRAIAWSSGSNSVARVDQSGLVSAVGIGTTTITATSEGVSGSVNVRVSSVPVASVTVTLASYQHSSRAGLRKQPLLSVTRAETSSLGGKSLGAVLQVQQSTRRQVSSPASCLGQRSSRPVVKVRVDQQRWPLR